MKKIILAILILLIAGTCFADWQQVYKVIPDTTTWLYEWRYRGQIGVGNDTTTVNAFMRYDGLIQGTSVQIGDAGAGNYLSINSTGVVTLVGSAKRSLNLRPDLDFSKITAQGKPTQIVYGAFLGYSLPTYAADEELFFSINTPGRWDGASDILVHVLVALSGGEDVDDDFRLQISWEHADVGEPIENTTHDVEVETNLLAGRVDPCDTYQVDFTLDYDVDAPDILETHDLIAMRLRRVAVAGTEIDGEIIVLDYHMEFIVDKMFRAP